MNLIPGTQQYVGDADLAVGVAGKPTRIYSVEVISTTTAATVKLFNGIDNTSTTQYAQVDGVISKSVVKNFSGGMRFPSGCFIDTGAYVTYMTVVFSQEF
jgi:hypothetical protein